MLRVVGVSRFDVSALVSWEVFLKSNYSFRKTHVETIKVRSVLNTVLLLN